MDGYTKLFSSIITSTIWQEDDKTRILWITMLALSDGEGVVEGSIPGIARLAGITTQECELAMAKLMSPDSYSRTQEFEGRRISQIDGGWIILNRKKYRNKDGSRTDYYREWRKKNKDKAQQKGRCAQRRATPRTQEKEKEEEKKEILNPLVLADFEDFWKIYPKKKAKADAKKAWDKAVKKGILPEMSVIEKAINTAKTTDTWQKENGQFIPYPATWLNGERWNDEAESQPGLFKPQDTPKPKSRFDGMTPEQLEREINEMTGHSK